MKDIIYDIECYPNLFCLTFLDPQTGNSSTFEMSDRKDEWGRFLKFVDVCKARFVRWVGFNNYYYDYQVVHKLMMFKPFYEMEDKADFAYQVSQKIINMPKEEKFRHVIWDKDHIVPQVDLFRIHHFDNMAKSTSLKKLEFNMRSDSIKDLPYKFDTKLSDEQKNEVIDYNIHDVKETTKLYHETIDMIKFRENLTKKYNKSFMNHNDTKIGKDYLIMELQNAGIGCYYITDEGRQPVQTKRESIVIKDVIFDYIGFQRPEFNAVVEWMERQVITKTKSVFTGIDDLGSLERYANLDKVKGKIKNLNCIINGFQFNFGTGGIHGSISSNIVEADDNFAIIDYDVTSLYPTIAIANKIYPEHLTEKFCEIYENMREQRLSYPKGTPENAMLKLALNGVYGDSNNGYSPFFDPQYTMTITINGQLMLCMLAEKMMQIKGLQLVQINTDGVTIRVPRTMIPYVELVSEEWQEFTGLQLERADYSKMFIRDVNNYIGFYTDGKIKRKGVYEYEREWYQNQSALIVQKAAEAHLIENKDISDYIHNHDNIFDFMLRTDVPRNSRLVVEYKDHVEQSQNTTRYFISNNGGQLVKVMPPLKYTKPMKYYEERATTPAKIRDFNILKNRRDKLGVADRERIININDGFKATVMNEMSKVEDINYDWYITEARKLVDPLWEGYVKGMME